MNEPGEPDGGRIFVRRRGLNAGFAKGKARRPYEFGVKVSIATTHKEGLVVGMCSMAGNPYDGHTLFETLEQVAIRSPRSVNTLSTSAQSSTRSTMSPPPHVMSMNPVPIRARP